MIANIDTISILFACLGVCLGGAAIAYGIEVAKRNHHALEKHRQDMNLYLNHRFSQQDKELRETLRNFRHLIGDVETSMETHVSQMKTLAQDLNGRMSSHSAQYVGWQNSFRESLAQLEQARHAQQNQISDLKHAMTTLSRRSKRSQPGEQSAIG